MLKRPLRDKENLPLRDRGHPKWKNFYATQTRINYRYLKYMNRLISSYVGKPWSECFNAILRHMKEDKFAEFANIKFVEDQFICLSPIKDFVVNRETGTKMEVYKDPDTGAVLGKDHFYVDENGNIQKAKSYFDAFAAENKKNTEQDLADFNGFIKGPYWLKKIDGVWHIADVAIQRLTEVKVNCIDPITKETVTKTLYKPKYKHCYGRVANSIYETYYRSTRGKYHYHLTKEERKIVDELARQEKANGLDRYYFSSFHMSDRIDSTCIPGQKVAINNKVCNKQILHRYGLKNDPADVQQQLRELRLNNQRRGIGAYDY